MPENQITTDFIYLTCSNFATVSHMNYWVQVNSWKNLWKFWNGPLCRNKSGPFPLPNVAAYWKSINTEDCAKTLSQILANNIDNGGQGIGLRIYVRYCRTKINVNMYVNKVCWRNKKLFLAFAALKQKEAILRNGLGTYKIVFNRHTKL